MATYMPMLRISMTKILGLISSLVIEDSLGKCPKDEGYRLA